MPTGISTTTWNSDLLSNGSILSRTKPVAGSATDSAISSATAKPSNTRLRAPFSSSSRGRNTPANTGASHAVNPVGGWGLPLWVSGGLGFIQMRASQGVTTKAMARESSMPMLALIGMGLMYGPISPVTKAMGKSAAITVSVARIVGPPTSSTAPGISCAKVFWGKSCWWRWMFSTTTIASSTRMPIEKISAKSDTRFNVKPQAQDANRVTVSVSTTAKPTMAASRRPRARNTSSTTEAVAKKSFWISFSALALADAP